MGGHVNILSVLTGAVVAWLFGRTRSNIATPAPPLTSRCAPVVVLVVATRVPDVPSNGWKLATSRNGAMSP